MKYLLLDISGIIYRSFFALNKEKFHRSDGLPTNSILGTINTIKHLQKKFKEYTFIACCDCSRRDLKRTENDPTYKTNRKSADPLLAKQFPYIFESINAMEITQLKLSGYEADDIIATFCHRFSHDNEIIIASNDKDMNQLLVYPNTQIYNMAKKELITSDHVIEKYKVTPHQFTFYQALVGDKVDNIPGVKGVGPKIACKLIEKFESVDNFQTSNKHKYQSHMDDFRKSLDLVTLKTDLDFEQSTFTKQNLKSNAFKEFCARMEIRY